MLGMIAEIEFFAQLGFRQGGGDFRIGQKFFKEIQGGDADKVIELSR